MLFRLFTTTFIFLSFFQAFSQTISSKKMDKWVTEKLPKILTTHREFVSLPNDAAFPKDMDKNIEWLEKAFQALDFEVKVLETGRIPLVYAESQFKNSDKMKTIVTKDSIGTTGTFSARKIL